MIHTRQLHRIAEFSSYYKSLLAMLLSSWLNLRARNLLFRDAFSKSLSFSSNRFIKLSRRALRSIEVDIVGDQRSEESATRDFEFKQMSMFFRRSAFSLSREFATPLFRSALSTVRFLSFSASLRAATLKCRPVFGPGFRPLSFYAAFLRVRGIDGLSLVEDWHIAHRTCQDTFLKSASS